MFTFEEIRAPERRSLYQARAQEWKGALTAEQFGLRNDRLYRHPYGSRIRTFALKNAQGQIVASLDRLPVTLRTFFQGQGGVIPGEILASVVTPQEFRGKGYGRELLARYADSLQDRAGVLYSDIGPEFYAKYGYQAFPRVECEIPLVRVTSVWPGIEPLPVSEVHGAMDETRTRALKRTEEGAFCLEPDPFFLDWQLERFHYFCETKGLDWSGQAGWRSETGEVFLAAPDPVTDSLCCLWSQTPVETILGALANVASRFGLSYIRAWMPVGNAADAQFEEPTVQCPMVRLPSSIPADLVWLDIQWCDWW